MAKMKLVQGEKTPLIPLGDRIVIEPVETETVTKSGLVLADAYKEKPQRGVVIAIGEKQVILKQGDLVLFSKYAGSEFPMDGHTYLVLDESDVLAKIASK